MIAKTDLTLITLASALLVVAIARSESGIRSRVGHVPNTVTPYVHSTTSEPVPNPTVTVATNTDSSNPVIAAQNSGGEIISTNAETFQEPDVIKDASFRTHIVKNGDVLSRIAIKYNTSVSQLQALNNLRGTVIHVGQELVYPTQ